MYPGTSMAAKKIVRDMSTPESCKFWETAKKAAAEVQTWPDWKRAGINVTQMREEPEPGSVTVTFTLHDALALSRLAEQPNDVPYSHAALHKVVLALAEARHACRK